MDIFGNSKANTWMSLDFTEEVILLDLNQR